MKIANKEMRGALRGVEDEYKRAKRIIRDGIFFLQIELLCYIEPVDTIPL